MLLKHRVECKNQNLRGNRIDKDFISFFKA